MDEFAILNPTPFLNVSLGVSNFLVENMPPSLLLVVGSSWATLTKQTFRLGFAESSNAVQAVSYRQV